jgi:hypothetical protein
VVDETLTRKRRAWQAARKRTIAYLQLLDPEADGGEEQEEGFPDLTDEACNEILEKRHALQRELIPMFLTRDEVVRMIEAFEDRGDIPEEAVQMRYAQAVLAELADGVGAAPSLAATKRALRAAKA